MATEAEQNRRPATIPGNRAKPRRFVAGASVLLGLLIDIGDMVAWRLGSPLLVAQVGNCMDVAMSEEFNETIQNRLSGRFHADVLVRGSAEKAP
jgi:hypothetical protein